MNKKTIIIIAVVIILIIIISGICYRYASDYIKKNIASGGKEINEYLEKHCSDPPVLNTKDFTWTSQFRKNWGAIQSEFYNYMKKYEVPEYRMVSSESSGNTKGWKALFLRVFENDTKLMDSFPKTKALLDGCNCTSAYFSMLEPGTHISPHKGVYKGVLRYHLGLDIPEDWEKCFIVVDGQKLHWHEGEDLLFDDMFLHHVENNTSQRRIVLFMDVKRDFKNPIVNFINNLMMKYITTNDELLKAVKRANAISQLEPEVYEKVMEKLGTK